MSLTGNLTSTLTAAFGLAGYTSAKAYAVPCQRLELADYQCNAAMALGKSLGLKPRLIAEAVAERLRDDTGLFADVSVAGPGFINLRLTDGTLGHAVGALLGDPHQGFDPASVTQRRIVIDFSGPNVAKEMLAYHVRSTVLGDSLQRILRFAGIM